MPSVEDIIKKNKLKKKTVTPKAESKHSSNIGKNINETEPKKEKKLADFDPFGVKFVNEYSNPSKENNSITENAIASEKNKDSDKKANKQEREYLETSPLNKAEKKCLSDDEDIITQQDNGLSGSANIVTVDIRLSSKQEIIYSLLRKHRNKETLITPVVKSSDLSKMLDMSETSLRKQIQRMEQKGALKRHRHISGPDGGTSYVVFDVEKEINSFLDELN